MRNFWISCKSLNRLTINPYKKLLENNILRKDYENYLKNKQIK